MDLEFQTHTKRDAAKRLGIYLPEPLIERVHKAADKAGVSFNEFVRAALRAATEK